MIVFYADIDNTLIYSYKHDIGRDRIGVEEYQGRTISYMTPRSYRLLEQIRKRTLFVPVTTRTAEQYGRIDFGFAPTYALICNGGILLENGQENKEWYAGSLELIKDAEDGLELGAERLAGDRYRSFEVRNIRGLFLFTKSRQPQETARMLRERLDGTGVDVFRNGEKVYVVPKQISKGTACRRFRKMLQEKEIYTVAAGDSAFDLPMMGAADLFMAPEGLCDTYGLKAGNIWDGQDRIFSDFVLERVADLSLCEGTEKECR